MPKPVHGRKTEGRSGFAQRLIRAREHAGFKSQEALARAIGVQRGAVAAWETDQYQPSLENLPALAKALRVSVDWLVTEPDLSDRELVDGSDALDDDQKGGGRRAQ